MLRFLPGRIKHDRRLQRLVLPACAIVIASILLALVLDLGARNAGSPAQRAARLAETGDLESADRLYWQALASKVDLETFVAFIDNRASG